MVEDVFRHLNHEAVDQKKEELHDRLKGLVVAAITVVIMVVIVVVAVVVVVLMAVGLGPPSLALTLLR